MDNGIYSTSTASYEISSNSESLTTITTTTTTNSPQAYYSYGGYPATMNSKSAPTMNYGSFSGYPNSDSYGYINTNNNYAGYYSGYQQRQQQQQQPQVVCQSYAHQQQQQQQTVGGGVYQSNTGAAFAPISSFQNTAVSASANANENYPTSTYYNPPADYQSGGGLGGYGNQNAASLWQPGSYGAQYPGYGAGEANRGYGSTNVGGGTAVQYQQHYKQWADYYTSQTEVTCAPGTENVATAMSTGILGVPGGYASVTSQQSAAYSVLAEASTDLATVQPSVVSSSVHDGYWKQGTPGLQTNDVNSIHSNLQTRMDSNPMYGSFQEQHKPECTQATNVHYPADNQVTQNHHAPLLPVHQSVQQPISQTVQRTVAQKVVPLDSQISKMQIPKNPRITTNVGLGFSKTDKENSVSSATPKPVYISVAPPKANDQVSSHNAADLVLKPGMFPKSLRGYVERALSRCKDNTQMAACQAVMKEVITKATADGTLYTRDWDTEPLLSLPNASTIINEMIESSTPDSSLVKNNRRSPSRRTKSRWEPLSVEKSVDKQTASLPDVKSGGWFNLREDRFSAGKLEKEYRGNLKFPSPDQKVTNKNSLRPAKKPRLGDGPSGGDDGGVSSDSDPEQNLTAYYPGAIALADTPEERKRRESRSKRFEKARGNRDANNHFRPKNAGAGTYIRKDSVLVLINNFEDGNIRPVEDIDWDSLTIKGTCQDIEKGYLRLTSAPDPTTVRPEEVLEKALLMVQNSQKNYFYKCDQLKSIRQDLTVQRIRNDLTVKVYETHARLAIEVGDLSEYNQCQSQLKVLYAEGNKGCHMEFSAYHLLCVILHSNNNRDLLSAMSRLSVEARKDQAVKHALEVRAAVTSGNYVLFFRLYKEAPNLNTCLMDLYVEKMRYAAVKCMCRSYRPTLAVSYIAQVLGFSRLFPEEPSGENDTDGVEECVEWLKAHGACLITDNSGEMLLDSKSSTSSLFMPEPEDAVAHGDATLAVNDFLTRFPE